MGKLSTTQIATIVMRATALADPTRVRIAEALAKNPLSVGQIAAALAAEPSTISKHLQVLFRAGLLTRQRAASTVIYSLVSVSLLDQLRAIAGPSSRR
jgi:DNA-binding transcriptional ArsR family regulator